LYRNWEGEREGGREHYGQGQHVITNRCNNDFAELHDYELLITVLEYELLRITITMALQKAGKEGSALRDHNCRSIQSYIPTSFFTSRSVFLSSSDATPSGNTISSAVINI
jgi:hypothetical protein